MKTALRENKAEWGVLDISRWDVGSHAERVPFDYGPEGSEGMSLSLSRKCSMQRDLRVLKNAKVGWFFFLKDIQEGLDSRRIVREVVRMGILVAQWGHFCPHCI